MLTVSDTENTNSGAYVSLEALQQLRYTAKQCLMRTGKSFAIRGGSHQSRMVNRGMEFEDVRPYQAGDDIRAIDWRVTARTQVTHSKRYSEEKEKPIITVVDQRRSSFFGSQPCFKSVYSCQLAAIINWATVASGDRSGGVVLGCDGIHDTRPARSHKTVNRWLQQLTTANHKLSATVRDTQTLGDGLQHVMRTTHTGTEIILFSDCYDLSEQCEQHLFYLSRRHRMSIVWIVDQLEMALPTMATASISNGQAVQSLPVSAAIREQFAQQYQQKYDALQALCQRLGIRFIQAPVQTAPADIAQALIHRTSTSTGVM
ncbi:DUF58 domain-containing protein [Eionea flava]